MEESLLASMSCSNPQPIATETPNVDAPSSQLSPPWNQENALVDSKVSELITYSKSLVGMSKLLNQLPFVY